MKLKSTALLLSMMSSLLCADTIKEKTLQSVLDDANMATKTLLLTLQSHMQEHMKKGGVMDALDFCSTQAYALTDEVNSKLPNGISTKRVSLKTRNPVNEAQSDEIKVLKDLESTKELPAYLLEKIDEHTYKFYKPLVIDKPICLKCHGDISTDKKLETAIKEKYPNDKALNYKMGDLRGAVVVTIKK
jgi:hypothetical protein